MHPLSRRNNTTKRISETFFEINLDSVKTIPIFVKNYYKLQAMLEIILAILLSIGVHTSGKNIIIQSATIAPDGTETVTFTDNASGDNYIMIGTEQNGWGIQSAGGSAPANDNTAH